MRAILSVAACVFVIGCAPPEAPDNLDDLSRYLFRSWHEDDVRIPGAGMAQLETFLMDVDLTSKQIDDRAWALTDLQDEDVVAIERPEDRRLEDVVGVGVAYQSRWPAVDHARLQAEADQTPAEPTAPTYVRSFPDVDDSACFPDRDCDILASVNETRRQNLLLAADFILFKNFRWVSYTREDGTEGLAFYARSWFEESWAGDKENVVLWQSYSIDVWIDRGDGTAWRYQTLWSETDVGFAVDDGLFIGTIKAGTQGVFEAGDSAIGELFHGE